MFLKVQMRDSCHLIHTLSKFKFMGQSSRDIIPVEKLTIVYLDMNDVVSFEIQKEDHVKLDNKQSHNN